MTKEEKKRNEILKGIENGKIIEYYCTDKIWRPNNVFVKDLFSSNTLNRLRVKPEPKLVPFDKNDNLIGVIAVSKENKDVRGLIVAQDTTIVSLGLMNITYSLLLEEYVDVDGVPLGKYVEE